jgi:CDP-paratose 2-epimerase
LGSITICGSTSSDRRAEIDGIDESMSIDQCLHSLFGATKVAADVMCQEFGRRFGMLVGVCRGGYLAYIVHSAVARKPYYRAPRAGDVYNLGGGRANSLSILETVDILAGMGYKLGYEYSEQNRTGDHICYISDLLKARSHFPGWKL